MSFSKAKNDGGVFCSFLEAGFLLIYEIASTIFLFLPPLIGFFFAYLILEYHSKTRQMQNLGISWYAAVCFLLFAGQIHGLYFFSIIIAFIIFYSIFFNWLFVSLKWRNGLMLIFILSGYLLSWSISVFFSYMQSEQLLSFGIEYFLYSVLEWGLAMIFLRERMV